MSQQFWIRWLYVVVIGTFLFGLNMILFPQFTHKISSIQLYYPHHEELKIFRKKQLTISS